MKKEIKLNESKLRNIIRESIKQTLNENSYDNFGNFQKDEHNQDVRQDIVNSLEKLSKSLNDSLTTLDRCNKFLVDDNSRVRDFVSSLIYANDGILNLSKRVEGFKRIIQQEIN